MADAFTAVLIAVAVCLTALVPLFLLALLIRRWIQRAPTDNAAKMRHNLVYIVVVAVVVIGANLNAFSKTKLWRRLSKACCIEIVNNSGIEVTDLDLALRSSSNPESENHHNNSMPNASRTWFEARADEYKVDKLSGTVGTNRFSFQGAAKKGERLVIAIQPGGTITPHVE